jgi:small ligand-binding sensory domain FIST
MARLAASRLVSGPYDAIRVRETAEELRQEVGGAPTFATVFATPDYGPQAADFLEQIRISGHVSTLAGCTGAGLAGRGQEQEEGSGFSLLFVSMPGLRARTLAIEQDLIESAQGPETWHERTGVAPAKVRGWLALLDPFSLDRDGWLKQWNQAYPQAPIFGSGAGGGANDAEALVFCDGRASSGGVVMSLEGDLSVQAVVSQGCKPIGEPLTVTQARRNVLLRLGSRPAYEVLHDVYRDLTDEEREQARGHLFAGLAVTEYLEEYKRGDFLVRNIIGADPDSGAVAINAVPRVGQTLQYQLRDSAMASDELRKLLRARADQPLPEPSAALLFTCHGRGRELFGRNHHDAGLIDDYFPGLPVAGVFSNAQIGSIGGRAFAHGYTASIALLTPPAVKG